MSYSVIMIGITTDEMPRYRRLIDQFLFCNPIQLFTLHTGEYCAFARLFRLITYL